jgi:DNA recombination-dependent growth factor C
LQKRDLRTNLSVVKTAVRHAKQILEVAILEAVLDLGKCMTQFALNVETVARFLLNPVMTVQFIAATASESNIYLYKIKAWNSLA